MLGFVLSKMNLMILVVALFAIIAYFTFSTAEVMKQNQAQLTVTRYTKDLSSMLTSATYCDRVSLFLPPYLAVIGKTTYYQMRVSVVDDDDKPFNGNFLVFSIISQDDPEFVLAASSVRTFADIHLFDFAEAGEVFDEFEQAGIIMDPQSAPLPQNGFAVLKKVIDGEQHVFIIPCNVPTFEVQGNVCDDQVYRAFNKIVNERKGAFGLETEEQISEFIC